MVIAETRGPPVLQQARRKTMTVTSGFEIAIMHQDVERLRDAAGRIVDHDGIQSFEGAAGIGREYPLGSCLSQDLHGDRVALSRRQAPPRDVSRSAPSRSAPRSQKFGAVDFSDVGHRHAVALLHHGGLPKTCEEGLYVVRNTDTECFVYGVCHAVVYRYSVTLGETFEALDAGFKAPGSQREGIEVVDAIGYAEPVHQRDEPDAAGYDEHRGAAFKPLERTAGASSGTLRPALHRRPRGAVA